MMKRIAFFTFLAAVLIIAAGAEEQQEASAKTSPVKLVWTTSSLPGDAHTQAMYVFKEEVEKLSSMGIIVDIFHSGQLFNQDNDKDAMIRGKVDMAYTSGSWLAQHISTASMFGAVYTFQSYNQMTKTLNGPVGQKLFEQSAAKLGLRPLGAFYMGTRQLNLIEKVGPVTTPQQMHSVKLRVPNTPAWIALGRALGANPTPMAFGEVYMGLKTGVVDGQDNPLPSDKTAKFYEVTKYIVLTDHVVDQVWPTINEKKWRSLTAQQQGWVKQALEKARAHCDKTNLDNEANILNFFREQGLIVIENPDKAAFAAYAKNFYLTAGKDISKDWDMALYEEIQKIK
jgi:tripartite ATP-independent transporter DctP family solute receptor